MEKRLSRVIGGLSLLKVAFMYRKEEQEILENAIQLLKEREPVPVELEGGGWSWWYVCGECHTAINARDRFCQECGRPLDWSGVTLRKRDENESDCTDADKDPEIE